MANYDTPRHYLNFNWTNFWYSSSFGVTWSCFNIGKQILPLTKSWLQSHRGLIYFCCCCRGCWM